MVAVLRGRSQDEGQIQWQWRWECTDPRHNRARRGPWTNSRKAADGKRRHNSTKHGWQSEVKD